MSLRRVKVRRVMRRVMPTAIESFAEPIFSTAQILTLAIAVVGTVLILQTADAEEAYREVSGWIIVAQAFGYVLVAWALISLIRAPFIVVRTDREKGGWVGPSSFIYRNPQLVGVVRWPEGDECKSVKVEFEDAEPNSMVEYSVELHPPAEGGRLAYFAEQVPSDLLLALERGDAVTSFSLQEWIAPGMRAGALGHGCVNLSGRTAELCIILEGRKDREVTARVYMHGFEIQERGNAR